MDPPPFFHIFPPHFLFLCGSAFELLVAFFLDYLSTIFFFLSFVFLLFLTSLLESDHRQHETWLSKLVYSPFHVFRGLRFFCPTTILQFLILPVENQPARPPPPLRLTPSSVFFSSLPFPFFQVDFPGLLGCLTMRSGLFSRPFYSFFILFPFLSHDFHLPPAPPLSIPPVLWPAEIAY